MALDILAGGHRVARVLANGYRAELHRHRGGAKERGRRGRWRRPMTPSSRRLERLGPHHAMPDTDASPSANRAG
jgi:hypothetical protein